MIISGISLLLVSLLFLVASSLHNNTIKKRFDVEYTLNIVPDSGSQLDLTGCRTGITDRLEANGIQFKSSIDQHNYFHISVSRIEDTNWVCSLVRSNAKLRIRELYFCSEIREVLEKLQLVEEELVDTSKKASAVDENDSSLSKNALELTKAMDRQNGYHGSDLSVIKSLNEYALDSLPELGYVAKKDTALARKMMNDPRILSVLPPHSVFLWGLNNNNLFPFYLARFHDDYAQTMITNKDLLEVGQDYDEGRIAITLQFRKSGTVKWAHLTRENIGRSVAIVVSNYVVTAPRVLSEIENGSATISGVFSFSDAIRMEEELKEDPLPAEIYLLSETIKPSERHWLSLKKILLGLACVLVFTFSGRLLYKTLKHT